MVRDVLPPSVTTSTSPGTSSPRVSPHWSSASPRRDSKQPFGAAMALKLTNTIEIPNSAASAFDHGAFDPKTRRIFIAHTGRDCIEVIDHDAGTHIATLPGFREAAGVVAAEGMVLVTNRGAANLAWVDAASLETQAVFKTGP